MKKGALKHFAKFTGKHLCQSLFFNEVAWNTSRRLLLSVMTSKTSVTHAE